MASALTHIGATRLATIRPEPTATLRTPASQPSSLTWLPPAGIRHSVSRVSADLVGGRGPSHGWPHGGNRSARLEVTARAGGARPRPAGARPSQRPPMRRQQQQTEDKDGPLMNSDIRVPTLRLLAEDQALLGIVSREEALSKAREAGLDLVMIAADAKPPVARIMDYSKFRYEQQKKKREQQKKAAASRQELKELKMRYNIDTGDYNVRLKQALKFLHDGDKVKLTAQFRGREMEFKELGVKLFEKFQHDVAELAIVESKAHLEGRSMHMVLAPNKAVLQRMAAAEEKSRRAAERSKRAETRGVVSGSESDGGESGGESDGESDGEEVVEVVKEKSGRQ
ncbi:unnamed protein product [Closterium sp. NIES-65]|nr:unnamed protein product [Closterium sp. NIES-65]